MKRFKNLLALATDDLVATASLINSAVDLARRNDAAITVLSVVGDAAGRRRKRKSVSPELRNLMVRQRLEELETLTRGVDVAVDHQVVFGLSRREVVDRVAMFGHDLVFVGGASMRSSRSSVSTALHLLRKCPVPVWVHSPSMATNRAIAVAVGPVGVDKTTEDLNVKLLELGASLASFQESRLHIIHAWRLDGDSMLSSRRLSYPWAEIDAMAKAVVTEARAELDWLIDRAGLGRDDISLHIQNGHSADVLIRAIGDLNPSVVVMGTMARSGFRGLVIGNTAERVITGVDRPVLAVKPDGFAVPARPDIDWDPAMLPY